MEEFNPHKAKCRCCGKTVKNGKKLRKLTSKIEQDFKNLTQLELKSSPRYSNCLCDQCFQRFEEFSKFRKNLIQHQLELNRIEEEETKLILKNFNDPKLCQSTPVLRLFKCPSHVLAANSSFAKECKVETDKFEMTNCVMIKCEPTVYEQEPQKEVNTFSDEKSADVESSDECLWFDDGAAEESDEMRAKPEVESTKNYEKKQLKLKKTATKVKKVKNAFTYEEVKCKKCDYVAPSIKMLHEHRKEYHRKLKDSNKIAKQKSTSGPASCPTCQKTFKAYAVLKSHIQRVHDKKKGAECDLCGFQFFDKQSMIRHFGRHLPKELRERVTCDFCGSKFVQKDSLRHHINLYHRARERLPCTFPGCTKSFVWKGHLTAHVRFFHLKIKNNKCNFCGEMVKNLKEHQQVKHSEHFELYLCDICSFSSKTATGLYKHKLGHEELKHRCPYEGCTKQFPFAFILRKHIEKLHEKKLDETCDICGKMFYGKRQLKVHKFHVHLSVRKSCPVANCNKTFRQRTYFRAHIKAHLDISEDEKAMYWKMAADLIPGPKSLKD